MSKIDSNNNLNKMSINSNRFTEFKFDYFNGIIEVIVVYSSVILSGS